MRHFAARDQLTAVVMERMLAGVSPALSALVEPVGEESSSRRGRRRSRPCRARSSRARREALARADVTPAGGRQAAVLMIDGGRAEGPHVRGRAGNHHRRREDPARLWEGSTENKAVAIELLSNLVHRGLDVERGVLGRDRRLQGTQGRGQRRARHPHPVQRCVCHKERNILDSPARPRPDSRQAPAPTSVAETRYEAALEQLQTARLRARAFPSGAAASLREGSRRRSPSLASASQASSRRRSRRPTRASR